MGTPTLLIQDGKILQKNLKKVKFDVNDLLEECRENGYFDIAQIQDAIMEADGSLSILPKSEYRPLTPKDMNLSVSKEGLVGNVIIDGKLMKQNLFYMGKKETWLKKELKELGYQTYRDILLATLDEKNHIQVYERNEEVKEKQILE